MELKPMIFLKKSGQRDWVLVVAEATSSTKRALERIALIGSVMVLAKQIIFVIPGGLLNTSITSGRKALSGSTYTGSTKRPAFL
jgi:hypothetical protein